jgi:hypothetical protein
MSNIREEYADQVATVLDREDYVASATVERNHKGVYVEMLVETKADLTQAYDRVDDYAIWIEVEVADGMEA